MSCPLEPLPLWGKYTVSRVCLCELWVLHAGLGSESTGLISVLVPVELQVALLG